MKNKLMSSRVQDTVGVWMCGGVGPLVNHDNKPRQAVVVGVGVGGGGDVVDVTVLPLLCPAGQDNS